MNGKTSEPPDALSRRRFLRRLSGAAGCMFTAHVLNGCVVAEVTPIAGGIYPFTVADLKDLANVDGVAGLDVGKRVILLIRVAQDTVVAFDNTCPHAGRPMEPGVSAWDGTRLTCQYHESTFTETGEYAGGAVTPWAGPEQGLTVYPVDFDPTSGTGTVTVGGES